jgi:serine/threonine protein kinase
MRRKASPSHDKLVEEARFILKNVQRSDVFGDEVELAEAERVLEPSLSLPFADFVTFFTKYGYLRLEQEGRTVAVTSGGREVAEAEEAEFRARVARHFARELTAAAGRPRSEPTALPVPLSMDAGVHGPTAVVRSRRPLGIVAPPANEVLDRRYERGALVGRSTFGVVHRGRHVSLGRALAIKEATSVFGFATYLSRERIVERIRSAVEAQAGLEHPYVLQIFDQNTEREHPYFVGELGVGGNLRRRLEAADGHLDASFAVRAFLQVALALEHAHARGRLHLGLKPENVLFDALGNVKVTDFGMSRVLDHPPEAAGPAPVIVGGNGVAYLAPELLQPAPPAEPGPSVDIYALGILAYEMLTGRLPGRRSPLPSAAREGIPEAFDEVFDRMTRDALEERYASMEEVLEGVYRAFDPALVFERGTLLGWARDPGPLPEPPPEASEPVEEVEEAALEPLDEDHPTPPPVVVQTPSGAPPPAADDLDLSRRGPRRSPPPPPEE